MYFTDQKTILGYTIFFTEGHIFVTAIAIMLILGRHVYLGHISRQPKFSTVYYQDVYFTDQNAIFKGIPVNGLGLAQICPKFQDIVTICIGREVADKILIFL